MNVDLWEQYQEDFADFTEAIFKVCNPITIRNLRTLLCNQGIWVERNKRVTVAQSLYNIIHEKDQTEWTKEEILDQFQETKELFASSKLNVIAGLIPDPLN
jgi:DNA-binding cell septation regulator SpoVG